MLLIRMTYPCVFCVAIDVNFLDDVGQSLLNWASAFGTEEMVSLHELRIAY